MSVNEIEEAVLRVTPAELDAFRTRFAEFAAPPRCSLKVTRLFSVRVTHTKSKVFCRVLHMVARPATSSKPKACRRAKVGIFITMRIAAAICQRARPSQADIRICQQSNHPHFVRDQRVALDAIQDGTYGLCASCEEVIPPKHMQAVPWARRCVRCQTEAKLICQDRRFVGRRLLDVAGGNGHLHSR